MDRRQRLRAGLVSSAVVTASAFAVLAVPGTAHAEPNCGIAHAMNKVADNDGGYWHLELDARCKDTLQSGTVGITWAIKFWAEPHGGGDPVAAFSNNGDPILPENREERGTRNFVQLGAPLGYSRYCYSATAMFKGPRFYGGEIYGKSTGTHCKDT